MSRLTLDDIADQRAYERERETFRAHIIDLKRRRRVAVGPVTSFVFENRDTVRFQIQEMARAERILTDEAIQVELDIYNPLIPLAGELSATLFLELTSDEALRHWLPRLVGIERAAVLRFGGDSVHSRPEDQHASFLTRDDTTASVHYVRFALSAEQVDRFEAGPVTLAFDHPEYREATTLSDLTRAELTSDLRAGG